ncbi:type I restriction enzyme S subunit [Mesoflavibacter sabulilitoris]|uniref:Type I restriction endonuclease subunit R n=1 Tax=Mesoflavibacter zeaxanthinifaciens subsp. sabulilitoris TaxID=1520893 RepID=A0A2T1NAD9_9FLAO|nr:restriction endonuclease subunit S [Mesoflavibacter zeaxanthinifaciens]MBB3123782.1 type I restriction enzyme S subunit [Mesoflavibacter zeaxanthinifaciens subsp. sabulilitoris]PSG89100.1 type I restriction endonuclease subunit R [Mesoflavibacter zeaxanthinifaciens subsp. sabulilitoris]
MNIVKAGDILKIKTGRYDANHGVADGKYTFFTCADIPSKANTFSFDDEVLILPGNGANVGNVYHYKGKLEAYQRTYVLYDIDAYPKFLYYYFSKYWIRQITKRQVGSATNYIKMDDIVSFKIPLPPLTTQKRIAQILDNAAALRDKTQQLLTEYDQLAQSIFLEMFGDPVINPKGWENESIDVISRKIQIGPFGSQLHQSDYKEFGYDLVNPTDINEGKIDLVNCRKIGVSKFDSLPNYHLEIGDLIMARRGDLSKIAIVQNENLFCGTGSLYIRFNEQVNSMYAFYVLNHKSSISKLYEKARGITMANLNKKIIKEFKIPVPTLNLQNQFAEKIGLIEQQKALVKQELQQTEDLFNCLLQKAFKGELV